MHSIHLFFFVLFPSLLFVGCIAKTKEEIGKTLDRAWLHIHEADDSLTPLWKNWYCKEKAGSKCRKHKAEFPKENAEVQRQHSEECQKWAKFKEKMFSFLEKWDLVKKWARKFAQEEIEKEKVKNSGISDQENERKIYEKWHNEKALNTLVFSENNGYIEFTQEGDFEPLNLIQALKVVEQAHRALIEGNQKMPKDIKFNNEKHYEAQMNAWDHLIKENIAKILDEGWLYIHTQNGQRNEMWSKWAQCDDNSNVNSEQCRKWGEFAEKMLSLLLTWEEVKKYERKIYEKWDNEALNTLLFSENNGYIEFIQEGVSEPLNLIKALKVVEQAHRELMEGNQKMPKDIKFKNEKHYEAQMDGWKFLLTGSSEDEDYSVVE